MPCGRCQLLLRWLLHCHCPLLLQNALLRVQQQQQLLRQATVSFEWQ
jgi:hypothetical protein